MADSIIDLLLGDVSNPDVWMRDLVMYIDDGDAAANNSGIAPDNTNPPITDISWASNKIIDLADPTSDQDAATKKYVDDNSGSSLGADNQIPVMNVGGTDFEYDPNFQYNSEKIKSIYLIL